MTEQQRTYLLAAIDIEANDLELTTEALAAWAQPGQARNYPTREQERAGAQLRRFAAKGWVTKTDRRSSCGWFAVWKFTRPGVEAAYRAFEDRHGYHPITQRPSPT